MKSFFACVVFGLALFFFSTTDFTKACWNGIPCSEDCICNDAFKLSNNLNGIHHGGNGHVEENSVVNKSISIKNHEDTFDNIE